MNQTKYTNGNNYKISAKIYTNKEAWHLRAIPVKLRDISQQIVS